LRVYEFILIGFGAALGALLGFGLELLRALIYGRLQAKKVKRRLYRNAEIELEDNLEKTTSALDLLKLITELAAVARVDLTRNLESGPPVLDASAFDALEKCYFLSGREQRDVSKHHPIIRIIDDHNVDLRLAWNYAKRGIDVDNNVEYIIKTLQKAEQNLSNFSTAFEKLKASLGIVRTKYRSAKT
jgi:hypothetical protein